ncbi:nucleotide sugar dehydrogenase [Brevibacterium antiquum]|uniref:Nucleotide sugar dehydrogenase n=1 Tax=Brevibacterium antiquum TaxID=234835 RepID=A0A2H1KM71_9MICO|nr:nucleotide sugar dehydrogenase [Brevibacterium antiquum]SMY00826.1 nucleotide sugar dehydrogenase [Brevibacterium antiquum]
MKQGIVTIVGQGYVGLPLAQTAVLAGWTVHGLDITSWVVSAINSGSSHIDDVSDAEIAEMLGSGYRATFDVRSVAESDVVVICVPTPLAEAGNPDLTAVEKASEDIAPHLAAGVTVILESTTYPGTTEDIVRPILERGSGMTVGKDFALAYSPERVNPGDHDHGIANTPKLVGGVDESSTSAAVEFYASFIDTVVPMTGVKEAETAKLLENTFRHVNIALVNEMAKFCHELGIDIWEVIRGASTKPFGFMKFTPGPGVGGHCIPIDPNYLSYEVRKALGYPFRFVELAQEVNSSMPRYVVDRIAELLNAERKPLNGSEVLLLGVTYKPDIADQRESPALPIAALLQRRGAIVEFHDPLVDTWQTENSVIARVDDVYEAASIADICVVLQPHGTYDLERISRHSKVLFDTQGVSRAPAVRL